MSGQRYTPEFKDEAVRQVVERGYSVADISKRLGISVRRVRALLTASFRYHLTMDTLAVRLVVPLTGPTEGSHLQVDCLLP